MLIVAVPVLTVTSPPTFSVPDVPPNVPPLLSVTGALIVPLPWRMPLTEALAGAIVALTFRMAPLLTPSVELNVPPLIVSVPLVAVTAPLYVSPASVPPVRETALPSVPLPWSVPLTVVLVGETDALRFSVAPLLTASVEPSAPPLIVSVPLAAVTAPLYVTAPPSVPPVRETGPPSAPLPWRV